MTEKIYVCLRCKKRIKTKPYSAFCVDCNEHMVQVFTVIFKGDEE